MKIKIVLLAISVLLICSCESGHKSPITQSDDEEYTIIYTDKTKGLSINRGLADIYKPLFDRGILDYNSILEQNQSEFFIEDHDGKKINVFAIISIKEKNTDVIATRDKTFDIAVIRDNNSNIDHYQLELKVLAPKEYKDLQGFLEMATVVKFIYKYSEV